MFRLEKFVSPSLLFVSVMMQIGWSYADPVQSIVNKAELQMRQETDFNFGWKFTQQAIKVH